MKKLGCMMCILGPTPLSIFRLSGIASWLAGVFFLAGWNLFLAGWSLLGWLFFFPGRLESLSGWLKSLSGWLECLPGWLDSFLACWSFFCICYLKLLADFGWNCFLAGFAMQRSSCKAV